jgi:short subunit dehydrogenase-like uncharacterized protein
LTTFTDFPLSKHETMPKKYDFVLFGVTGFTGKLAAEYVIERSSSGRDEYSSLQWACSARNIAKAEELLKTLLEHCGNKDVYVPPVLQVDMLCETKEEEVKLRAIVQSTKVVLTCSGPFELYGKTLVKLCAEEGVHYADITGETDFVRGIISAHDAKARQTGACIISHCGNDCVPADLTVWEMSEYAKSNGMNLREVQTYEEYGSGASWSGGTLATAG